MSKAFSREVLSALRRHGSDLTKEHDFEFYLYAPTKILVSKAAKKIRESGFTTNVSRSGKHWLCVASRKFIPATANIGDQGRFFEQVATAVGGDFDGWEASLVES